MEKSTLRAQIGKDRRGRHPIDPKIEHFIAHEVFENMRQHPENRLPKGVLAHRIHESLLKQYRNKKRARIPKVGTIEKKIGKYNKEPARIDGPWSIFSLAEFPIAAEAIPTILQLWIARREKLGRDLTVREAQWAARLYTVVKNAPLHFLAFISSLYAEDERMAESSDIPLIPDRSLDLGVFEAMTGQKITPEHAQKILGHEEIDPNKMEMMMLPPQQGAKPLPEGALGELVTIREMLREIAGTK